MIPNLPSPAGRVLGVELARFADAAALDRPRARPRCESCAFRAGTVPNGCLATVANAFKCVLEGEPFRCHETEDEDGQPPVCAGWGLLRAVQPVNVPWDFIPGSD